MRTLLLLWPAVLGVQACGPDASSGTGRSAVKSGDEGKPLSGVLHSKGKKSDLPAKTCREVLALIRELEGRKGDDPADLVKSGPLATHRFYLYFAEAPKEDPDLILRYYESEEAIVISAGKQFKVTPDLAGRLNRLLKSR
jgi:hypothetical protein